MPSTKLHPLRTPELVYRHLLDTGCYMGDRCTGRSTSLALGFIAEALRKPGVTVYIKDHHDSSLADRHLTDKVAEYVDRLGLKHLIIDRQCYWIRFGD